MTEAIPAWAVPGAIVVCVDVSYDNYTMGKEWLERLDKQTVYTIRSTGRSPSGNLPFIRLREIAVTTRWSNGEELGYSLNRFRPAVEPKSEAHDVAMFTELAKTCTIVERLDRVILHEEPDPWAALDEDSPRFWRL